MNGKRVVITGVGLASPIGNSLDAVSDRDFAIEFAACAATLSMHLSRFAEELVLWSSPRFGFVDLSKLDIQFALIFQCAFVRGIYGQRLAVVGHRLRAIADGSVRSQRTALFTSWTGAGKWASPDRR